MIGDARQGEGVAPSDDDAALASSGANPAVSPLRAPPANALLSAVVSLLLASCGSSVSSDAQAEEIDIAYTTIGIIAERDTPQGAYARNALADGRLTKAEYSETIDLGYRLRKAATLDRWVRPATQSGTGK